LENGSRADARVDRVLIVDGDARVRRALRALIQGELDTAVVEEAASAEQALRCVATLRPSAILLDLTLPTRQDGLAALRRLVERGHRCVAISWDGDLREAALEAGASLFIEKGATPHAILAALRASCFA
jgi:DNA-binding NarL/FixJ family response regulator